MVISNLPTQFVKPSVKSTTAAQRRPQTQLAPRSTTLPITRGDYPERQGHRSGAIAFNALTLAPASSAPAVHPVKRLHTVNGDHNRGIEAGQQPDLCDKPLLQRRVRQGHVTSTCLLRAG